MIPAPDAMRCDARHPSNSLLRCFRVAGHDKPHQHEVPSTLPGYRSSWVRAWRDETCPAPPSEFPEGPYVDDTPQPLWRSE